MRVAIVGAGPAGCAAAIELRRRDVEVMLISDGMDSVGEQLAPSARPLLEQLDLLPLLDQLECVGVRAAWFSEELHDQSFLFHPFGHGWLLDRSRFGTQLRERAVAMGVILHEPTRLVGLERDRSWDLQLSNGSLRADFLIDASGRRSAVAQLRGVRRRRFDRQFAVIGWLDTEQDDADATLTVESCGSGWWYTSRLPGGRRVAAWITNQRPDIAQWEPMLRATRHVSALVHHYQVSRSPIVRSAGSSFLEHTSGCGWVAIGDAAASYDPLASRGLVTALRSGIEAAALVDAPAEQMAVYHSELEERFHSYLTERRRYYRARKAPETSWQFEVRWSEA